jgi:hypothetical protein
MNYEMSDGPRVVASSSVHHSPGSDVRTRSTPLRFSSATALARTIRSSQLSSEAVTAAFPARIRDVKPKIDAASPMPRSAKP